MQLAEPFVIFGDLLETQKKQLEGQPTETSFMANKVRFTHKLTHQEYQLLDTKIQIRGSYLLQTRISNCAIVSSIKLNYTVKCKKQCPLEHYNVSSPKQVKFSSVTLYIPCQSCNYFSKYFHEEPFSENYIELEIYSCQPSLLNFFQILNEKPITQKIQSLKQLYKPIQNLQISHSLKFIKTRHIENEQEFIVRPYPKSLSQPIFDFMLLKQISLTILANGNGIKTPHRFYQTNNTFYQILKLNRILTLESLVQYKALTHQTVKAIMRLLLHNVQTLIKKGIQLPELKPTNILIEQTTQHSIMIHFLNYNAIEGEQFIAGLQEEGKGHQKQVLQILKEKKLEAFRNIGLVFYYMLTQDPRIFHKNLYENPENILNQLEQLQAHTLSESALKLLQILISEEEQLFTAEQLLGCEFFLM